MSQTVKTSPYPDDSDLEEVVLDRRPLLYLLLAGLLCLLLLIWERVFIVIPAGRGGVLFQPLFGGVVLNRVYGEGLKVIWPWDTMTVYELRVQEKTLDFPVLNTDGLELKVKVSIRYHPREDSLAFLHQRIGPDYEAKLIAPTCEYCVRDLMGSASINDLYFNRDDIMTRLNREIAMYLGQRYVDLDGVFVRGITLPPLIAQAIEHKEEQRQLFESYDFRIRKERREVLRKTIEGFGVRTYNSLISQGLDDRVLKWRGIAATEALGQSPNAKVVIVGNGPNGLPLILGNEPGGTMAKTPTPAAKPTQTTNDLEQLMTGLQTSLKDLLNSVERSMGLSKESEPDSPTTGP